MWLGYHAFKNFEAGDMLEIEIYDVIKIRKKQQQDRTT
jgi:hypothetical protein